MIVGGSLDSVTHAAGWPGAGCMALSLLGVILTLTNTTTIPALAALAVLAAALGVIAATGTWHTRTT
ncbi:MAG: hypothetical protein L0H79_18060 [Intrasporangium sp.]|uniref:hypothetical protein n=1 Tax=Intrasporangium sp. TaxID=1925024 RepID=UPI002648B4C7|nr:hypothetical protein [Intrasporangium sp.]MDN5797633.1 hypothetical protein [Intrasporangium sp.]